MGIELKLSDRELPASPVFIQFLAHALLPTAAEPQVWPDQLSEQLWHVDAEQHQRVARAAEQVMRVEQGRAWVARAYSLFVSLLTGDLEPLEQLQSRFRFIIITGIPRTGGSYLTAEIYKSLNIDPHTVPNVIAHDSFPEAGPYLLVPGFNSWTTTLKSTAEFLTIVEIFFDGHCARSGKIVVPKKLTQSVYAAAFFQRVFGPDSEHIFTVRHPVAACISTYEKSGGFPREGRFDVRSNIEAWCRRDLEHQGWSAAQLSAMDYFDVYLRYWEHYHLRLATDMTVMHRRPRVVAYGADAFTSLAQHYHDLHESRLQAAPFQVADEAQRRHPVWIDLAAPSIDRIANIWQSMGLAFPREEIAQAM
jgi:hypothetical protein